MKAVEIQAFGSPEGLAVIDLPDPSPADGQVLIATEAIGVGGVDAVIRSGAIAGYGFTEGHILGSEVAGTMTAVGGGIDTSWVGQRVWAFTGLGGGYVEQAIAPVEEILPLPANLSAVDAVTLGSSGVVAHFGLAHARFAPGESVLVRGAAGSIGIMTVQLAARGGASAVAVTTSSAERGDGLRKLGATHMLDRAGEGGEDAPAGYDVIIDIAAGADMPSFFARLNPNGRMVVVGVVAGYPPADFGMTMMAAFQKSMSFATFSTDTVPEPDRRAVRIEQFEAASRGELQMVVHEALPLQAVLAQWKSRRESATLACARATATRAFPLLLLPGCLRARDFWSLRSFRSARRRNFGDRITVPSDSTANHVRPRSIPSRRCRRAREDSSPPERKRDRLIGVRSAGIIKMLEGRHGDTYPGMAWEPKAAFTAVAECYRG